METLYHEVQKLTVKNLQKSIKKMGIDIRGMYKEDKDYFIEILIDSLRVSSNQNFVSKTIRSSNNTLEGS